MSDAQCWHWETRGAKKTIGNMFDIPIKVPRGSFLELCISQTYFCTNADLSHIHSCLAHSNSFMNLDPTMCNPLTGYSHSIVLDLSIRGCNFLHTFVVIFCC